QAGKSRRKTGRGTRPGLEMLETRELPSSAAADFALSGYRWANPGRITYSIAPDGVLWDHGKNDLNADFDGKVVNWQREIARALATWESVATLDIALFSDGPFDENSLGQAQGDSRFGDIRIGGYAFAGDSHTLAQTYFPPPNGVTAAGDIEINTSMDWNI